MLDRTQLLLNSEVDLVRKHMTACLDFSSRFQSLGKQRQGLICIPSPNIYSSLALYRKHWFVWDWSNCSLSGNTCSPENRRAVHYNCSADRKSLRNGFRKPTAFSTAYELFTATQIIKFCHICRFQSFPKLSMQNASHAEHFKATTNAGQLQPDQCQLSRSQMWQHQSMSRRYRWVWMPGFNQVQLFTKRQVRLKCYE